MVQVHVSGGASEECTLVSEIAKARQHLKNSLERVSMISLHPHTKNPSSLTQFLYIHIHSHPHLTINNLHSHKNTKYKTPKRQRIQFVSDSKSFLLLSDRRFYIIIVLCLTTFLWSYQTVRHFIFYILYPTNIRFLNISIGTETTSKIENKILFLNAGYIFVLCFLRFYFRFFDRT